jgi:hypothetical protein
METLELFFKNNLPFSCPIICLHKPETKLSDKESAGWGLKRKKY